jgi:hypothetical protein
MEADLKWSYTIEMMNPTNEGVCTNEQKTDLISSL